MDILVFYDGSEEDVAKYLRGFLLWGYVALAVFALWSLVLLILFMRGRQRAGFLSSRSIAARGKVDATARDEEDWGDANQSTTSSAESIQRPRPAAPLNTLPNYIRIIFVMLCVLVFVLAVLFMTQGLQRLQETFDTYHSTAVRVEDITEQGQALLDQGIEAVRDTIAVIRTVLDQESIAESFCPGVDIYQDVPGFAGTALSQVDRARDAFDQVGVARDAVDLVEDYIDGEVQDISSRLDKFGQDTSNAETELDKIHLVNGWTWFIFVCYAVIPLLMIISTVLAMHNRENLLLRRYTRFVAWPVFIILTLSLVATLVALPVAGGVNSDFCLPMGEGSSPDDLIFEVLQREGLAPGSFTYVTADFYIRQQCQDGEDPLDQVNFYLGELVCLQVLVVLLWKALRSHLFNNLWQYFHLRRPITDNQ